MHMYNVFLQKKWKVLSGFLMFSQCLREQSKQFLLIMFHLFEPNIIFYWLETLKTDIVLCMDLPLEKKNYLIINKEINHLLFLNECDTPSRSGVSNIVLTYFKQLKIDSDRFDRCIFHIAGLHWKPIKIKHV